MKLSNEIIIFFFKQMYTIFNFFFPLTLYLFPQDFQVFWFWIDFKHIPF